jgi:hypothetical protein
MSTMVGRAARLRCPVCGSGGLFVRPVANGGRRRLHLGLPASCPRCQLRFDREAGHWTGSLGLNVIVSFTALFVVLMGGVLLTWPTPPAVAIAATALSVSLLLPLLFAPWSATFWLVIDLRLRPLEPGEAPGRSSATPPGTTPPGTTPTGTTGSAGDGDADDRETGGQSPAS